MNEQKRRGRPTKPPVDGGRISLGLRVTADLKRRLDDAAGASGRSQSQEAELRLEQSFERQSLLRETLALVYGEEWATFLAKAHDAGILKMRPSDKAAVLRKTAELLNTIPDAPERPKREVQSAEQMLGIAKDLTRALGGTVVKK